MSLAEVDFEKKKTAIAAIATAAVVVTVVMSQSDDASPDICRCDQQEPQPHTTTGSIWLKHAELLAMTSGHRIAYQSCVGQKIQSNNLEPSWLIQ